MSTFFLMSGDKRLMHIIETWGRQDRVGKLYSNKIEMRR